MRGLISIDLSPAEACMPFNNINLPEMRTHQRNEASHLHGSLAKIVQIINISFLN